MDCSTPAVDGLRLHPPNLDQWPPPEGVWSFGADGIRSWRGLMSPGPGALAPTVPWGYVSEMPPDSGPGYMPMRPVVPERAHGLLIQEQA